MEENRKEQLNVHKETQKELKLCSIYKKKF